jgi:DNA-binding NarL/FixJ family response regulator
MQLGRYQPSPIEQLIRPTQIPDIGRGVQRSRISDRGNQLPSELESPIPDASTVIKLALIGGGRLMRGATANLLAAQEGFEVQGAFESPAHFLASDLGGQSDVLLLDCDGDPASCRTAVSVLTRAHGEAKLVMLCQEVSQETIRCAMEYRVGGVLLKSYSTEDIAQAIRYMASGRTIMPAGWQRAAAPIRCDPLALSPRLRQILILIAQGLGNDEIAAHLALSPNTIKFHVRALYARLGVHNRVEASTLYAQMIRGEG